MSGKHPESAVRRCGKSSVCTRRCDVRGRPIFWSRSDLSELNAPRIVHVAVEGKAAAARPSPVILANHVEWQ